MLLEIALSVIAITLIALVGVLVKISAQTERALSHLGEDVHNLSLEMTNLINTVNEFVESNLHDVSRETTRLVSKLNELSSDITAKSHSLNFLFKPLSFLNSKLDATSSVEEDSGSNRDTIPQILRWIASSASLFKTTKEFIKK